MIIQINQLYRGTIALVLFAAGCLMALGFAPFNLWPVIFIALPIFYVLLTASNSVGQALWRGFCFGYGYFMASTWWIANSLLVDADKFAWMLPFSILGLSAAMAAWFMVFGFFVYCCRRIMSPPLFAALWVVIEYLRTFGMFGFPWNLLGYMGLASLPFTQIASLIGTYGLSFLLLLIALTPVYWFAPVRRSLRFMMASLVLVLVVLCYAYGSQRLQNPTEFSETTIRVVQPSIPQEIKSSPKGRDLAIEVLGRLTNQRVLSDQLDITIWPETAYPFTISEGDAQSVPDIRFLITGAVRAEGLRPDIKIWNSVVVLGVEGSVITTYDKHQLVPFGEFVPLRNLLPLDKITPGDTDFSRGSGAATIAIDGLPSFSPFICYEAIFPWIVVNQKARPAWLLNVTNDGWFGISAGPYQHLTMARLRAIEQGLPLVRAANNGVSVVTDSYGRILGSLALNARGVIDMKLPQPLSQTTYGTYRELPVLALLTLVFALSIYVTRGAKHK